MLGPQDQGGGSAGELDMPPGGLGLPLLLQAGSSRRGQHLSWGSKAAQARCTRSAGRLDHPENPSMLLIPQQ